MPNLDPSSQDTPVTDVVNGFFEKTVETISEAGAVALRNISAALRAESHNAQAQAERAAAIIANLDTLNTSVFQSLSQVDTRKLSTDMQLKIETYFAETGKSDVLAELAKQRNEAARYLEAFGRNLGNLMNGLEVLSIVSDPGATDYSVSRGLIGLGATIIAGEVFGSLAAAGVLGTVASVVLSVGVGYAAKLAYDAYASRVGLDPNTSPPFYTALLKQLGLAATVLSGGDRPAFLDKILPNDKGSIAIQPANSKQIYVFGEQYAYCITPYYKNLGYDVVAYDNQQIAPLASMLLNPAGQSPAKLPEMAYKNGYNANSIIDTCTSYTDGTRDWWVKEFDPVGRLVELRSYQANTKALIDRTLFDPDSSKMTRIDYFDLNGKIARQEHFTPDSELSYMHHFYDAQGRELSRDRLDPQTGKVIGRDLFDIDTGKVRNVLTLDPATGKTSIEERLDPKSGAVIDRSYFDQTSGKLMARDIFIIPGNKNPPNTHEVYDYASGTMTRTAILPGQGGERVTYQLDHIDEPMGRISVVTIRRDGSLGNRTYFNPSTHESVVEEYPNGALYPSTQSTYDGDRKLTVRRLFDPETGKPKTAQFFDAQGNEITDELYNPETGKLIQSNTFIPTLKTSIAETYYDDHGNVARYQTYDHVTGLEDSRAVYAAGSKHPIYLSHFGADQRETYRDEYSPDTGKQTARYDFTPGSQYPEKISYFDDGGQIIKVRLFDPNGVERHPPAAPIFTKPSPITHPVVNIPPPPKAPDFSSFIHPPTNETGKKPLFPPITPLPKPYIPTLHPLPGDHLGTGGSLGSWSSVDTVGVGTRWSHYMPGSDIPDLTFDVPAGPMTGVSAFAARLSSAPSAGSMAPPVAVPNSNASSHADVLIQSIAAFSTSAPGAASLGHDPQRINPLTLAASPH